VTWAQILGWGCAGLLLAALIVSFWRPGPVVAILLGGASIAGAIIGGERLLTWRESRRDAGPPGPPDTGNE
jgi:hypothetical protein